MKYRILLSLIAGGFALGAALSSAFSAPPDRLERIAELGKEICVPFLYGETAASPASLGLHPVPNVAPGMHLDLISKSFVQTRKHSCTIVNHDENALLPTETVDLWVLIETLITEEFPQLLPSKTDEMTETNSLIRAWSTENFNELARWGVSVYSFSPTGTDRDYSALLFYKPVKGPVERPDR
ncbi:MAG: hypothetical protein AB3N24_24000 [Leisingera sp.]